VPPASAIQTAASKSFLFMETSHASLAAKLPEPGGGIRDGHHVSGVLNYWIAFQRVTHRARGKRLRAKAGCTPGAGSIKIVNVKKPILRKQIMTQFRGRAVCGSYAVENGVVKVRTPDGEKTARLVGVYCGSWRQKEGLRPKESGPASGAAIRVMKCCITALFKHGTVFFVPIK
jgi:hypothetical protein